VVDETSGTCRSSERFVHDAKGDEDGGGEEKKKRTAVVLAKDTNN